MTPEQAGSKLGIIPATPPVMPDVPRQVVVGELLTENFAHLVTYCNGERWLTGWDVDINGNFVDSMFCRWFKIIKKQDGGPFRMAKSFVSQKHSVTLETRLNFSGLVSGVSFSLLEGEREAVRIVTDRPDLYAPGEECAIKVVADIDAQRYSLFVNGFLRDSELPFEATVSGLDRIAIQIEDKAEGEIFLRTVRLHTGYCLNERLISALPGPVPEGWTTEAGPANVCVREVWSDLAPDHFSFYLKNSKAVTPVNLSKAFQPLRGKAIADFQVMFPTTGAGFRAEISTAAGSVLILAADESALRCLTPDGDILLWDRYRTNVWYRLKAAIDPATGTATVWVNGKKKAQGARLWLRENEDGEVCFTSGTDERFDCWLDDILVYPHQDLPHDYVPAPEVAETGSFQIGVQCCSLWKEGSHNGWDPVSRDLRRKPVLGWYEEGKPETSDWQTKWMAEHGIAFNLYCWYPPFGRGAVPIKRSLSDYDLVDGFYYGEYSHHVKYMIMWENGNTTCEGFEDYKDHLVPFWIENHYKDPRYFTVDGKPVMGFYDPMKLIKQVGGEDNAAKALAYLREECVKAGLKGIHIICEYRGEDPILLKKFKDMGFEYSYSYTWFTGDPEVQKAKNLAQKKADGISIIPTACMGWMPSAWGGKDVSWSTPEEFRSLLSWMKEEFMPEFPASDFGNRMVMIGNWNEYGEGHFVMPANLYGFGYLDAIRSVFSSCDTAHTDTIPTARQIARIDTLYPRGWT